MLSLLAMQHASCHMYTGSIRWKRFFSQNKYKNEYEQFCRRRCTFDIFLITFKIDSAEVITQHISKTQH